MTECKKIAVLILTWNALPLLKQYLPIVARETNPRLADVIVADNGSNDGSADYVESLGIRVIKLDRNYGFAEGYNKAIDILEQGDTRYPYTLLLNNDVRVRGNWIEPLLDHMECNPLTAAVQPLLLSDRETNYFEYAGAGGGYLDLLGYPFCRGRIFSTLETYREGDKPKYSLYPSSVFWATGAALLIKTELYRALGGFDISFFAHQEEIDLAWRLHRKGYTMAVVPSSVVYHLGGGTLANNNPIKTYLNFRNNLRMLWKNLPESYGIKYLTLTIRLFLDILASLSFLPSNKGPKKALAVWRAWRDFLKERLSQLCGKTDNKIFRRREESIQEEKGKIMAYQKLYKHSILLRYHLYKEKTFRELKK